MVGSINVDTTLAVAHLPEPGQTVLARGRATCLGGKGANQAAALARLGAWVRLVGAVGGDPAGRDAVRELGEAGVDTSTVRVLADRPTGAAFISVDDAGENQIVVEPGANAHVEVPQGRLSADVTLCQLEIPATAVDAAARAATGFFAVNAAPARPLAPETLARADLVVVNRLEYAALPELHQAACVVVTDGARGARLLRRGRVAARVDGVPATVVSTVGAGDAFTAAVVLSLAVGLAAHEALAVAARVGAQAVASPLSQPRLDRLDAYLGRASP